MAEAEVNDAALVASPKTEGPDLAKASRIQFEAVAELLKSAYAKEVVLTPEESKGLQLDFPDEAFKTGAAGKDHLIYIEHANLRDRLNEVLGLGQWRLLRIRSWDEPFEHEKWDNGKSYTVQGIKVYFEGVLTIRGAYVGCAIGDMDYYLNNLSTNYGDAYEGAKTAAFRRCAKEFGVGLQAWRKEFGEGWFKRRGQRRPAGDPREQQGDVERGQQRHQENQQRKAAETNAEAVTGGKENQQPAEQTQITRGYTNFKCPKCDAIAVGRSKWPPRNKPDTPKHQYGFHCYEKSGGCKSNFPYDDPAFQGGAPKQEPAKTAAPPKEEQKHEVSLDAYKDGWREWCANNPGAEGFNKGYQASVEDLKRLDPNSRTVMWEFLKMLAIEQGLRWDKPSGKFVAVAK